MNESGWAGGYQPEAIKPNIVEREGNYWLKIVNVTTGNIQPKAAGDMAKRYFQIECIINAPGTPKVSIFLTEGPKFNAHATAFFDTFSIQRGDFNSNDWIGRTGMMKIELKQKGEYMNMDPRYILDENGYVILPNRGVATEQQKAGYQQSMPSGPQGNTFGAVPDGTLNDETIPF